MHFSFTPAVGEAVRVSVPLWHTTNVQLHLTASLSSQDYHEFTRDGAKLQLWSDIPSNGRNVGEWGELNFQGPRDDEPTNGSGTHEISLLPVDKEQQEEKSTFSLLLSVPLLSESHVFSFTYRVAYPSGDYRWLGSYGHNGSLTLDRLDSHLKLGEGWRNHDGNISWSADGRLVEEFHVAKISSPKEWTVWGIGSDSFIGGYKDCSLLIFVPTSRNTVLLPQAFIVAASPETTVSLNHGSITATGSGSVVLETYDPKSSSSDALIERLLALCPANNFRFVGTFEDHIVLASQETYPVKVAVIPLSPSPSEARPQLLIPLAKLSNLLGQDVTQFSIFTPANLSVHFMTSPPANGDESETLALHIPPAGGHMKLSPLYTLRVATDSTAECQVSILTPYNVIASASVPDPEDVLPTPPPSPNLRPIAHLSPYKASDQNDSTMSISDIASGIPSRIATPVPDRFISEASSVLTVRPQLRTAQSAQSVLSGEGTSHVGVVAYIKYLYVIVGMFIRTLLRNLLGKSGGSEDERPGVTTRASESQSQVDERTPLLAQVVEEDARTQEEETVYSRPATPALQVQEAGPQLAVAPATSAGTSSPLPQPFSVFVDVPAGQISLILRNRPDPPTYRLALEYNGNYVEDLETKGLGDGSQLIEIATETVGKHGGRMRLDAVSL